MHHSVNAAAIEEEKRAARNEKALNDLSMLLKTECVILTIAELIQVLNTGAFLTIFVVAGDNCENDDTKVPAEAHKVTNDTNVANWPQ